MLILLLFLFRVKKNWIKPLGVTAVCLLLLVQFKRYEGLSANEFIVFNSSQTCLLYREGKTCIAFVDDVPEDRVVRMVDDYVRRFNGKVIFHDLSLHHEYAIGNNIWINKDESNNLYFEIVDKRYSIIRSYKSFPVRKSTRIYAAYIEAPPGAISLAQGYLKFEF